MSALDLFRSRKALAAGVGLTTRRNKVLPAAADDTPIPARIGQGNPKLNASTSVVERRTFLFSLFGGTSATLANRVPGSSSMRIVALNIAVQAATYCIGRLNTYASRWRDCWRIDGLTFGINGDVPHPAMAGFSTVPAHERSALPYVANDGDYYPYCIGDPARSTLFIGQAQESVTPVVRSISTAGAELSAINGTNVANNTYCAAGLRLDASEQYRMYGMIIGQTSDVVLYLQPSWSIIRASRTTPWLEELSYGAYQRIDIRGNPWLSSYNAVNSDPASNSHTSAPYVISPTLVTYWMWKTVSSISPGTAPNWPLSWDETYDQTDTLTTGDYSSSSGEAAIQRTSSASYTKDDSISAYAYVGADIELNLLATLSVDYAKHRKMSSRFYDGAFADITGGSVHDSGATAAMTTRVTLSSTLTVLGNLTDIVCTLTGDYIYSDYYVPSVVSIPAPFGVTTGHSDIYYTEPAMLAAIAVISTPEYGKTPANAVLSSHSITESGTRQRLLNAKTKDYLFADIDEEIFLTLESTLTLTRNEAWDTVPNSWSLSVPDVYNLDLKYVLSVRGTPHEFSVYNGSGFTAPVIDTLSILAGDTGDVDLSSPEPVANHHTEYHPGYKPPPIFSPPFLAQGNCPYIAYTTAAEEANGAAPEMYLDISIKVLKYTTFTGDRYTTGVVPFVPHQFLAMFRRYIGGEQKTNYPTYPLTQNSGFWDTLFPSATPKRIQFANGAAGAWNTVLGAPFTSNPTTEITRL